MFCVFNCADEMDRCIVLVALGMKKFYSFSLLLHPTIELWLEIGSGGQKLS